MVDPAGNPITADTLLARREDARDRGVVDAFDELCPGASPAVGDEFLRRLADVVAAERAFESTWEYPPGRAHGTFLPWGRAGRYVDPTVRAEAGMGVLYVAVDVELGRPVADQVMKPGLDGDPDARERFFREPEITSRVSHPGIAIVFGRLDDDSGMPAYATASIQGHTLAASIDRSWTPGRSGFAAGRGGTGRRWPPP